MAVAFSDVGPSSAGATSSSSTTVTWSHTLGSTSALVVGVALGAATSTGISVTAKLDPSGANTTIPLLGSRVNSGAATAGYAQLFGLPNVSAGAHTITITAAGGTPAQMEAGSVAYTGAGTVNPFGPQQSSAAQGVTNPTITHTGTTSGNMVAALCAFGQPINTGNSAGTQRWVRNVGTSNAAGNGSMADIAAGGSQTITFAGAASDWYGIASVEVAATDFTVPISRVATTTGAPASAAAFTPTLPTHATGDRLILAVVGKAETTSVPTINQSWVLLKSGTGGTGTNAADTGQTFWAIYAKDATSGSETAPTVTPGGTAPNSWEWICSSYRPPSGGAWRDTITTSAAWVQSASDTTTASPLTGTAGAFTGVQPQEGDGVMVVGVVPTDLGTALGATTITATGLSGGTVTSATTQYVENALGNDTAAVWADWIGFTGTASAGVAASMAVTGASLQAGSIIAIALRNGSSAGAVTLTPAVTTFSAIAVSPVPQPITVNLTPVTMTLSGVATSPAPQPGAVTLTPAALALSGISVTATPQPVTVSLTTAVLSLSAVSVTPTPGQVTTALTAAVLSLSARTVTATPGQITQALTPASASFSAVAVSPTPQPVTLGLTAAVLSLSARPVTSTPGQVTQALTAAILSLSAVSVGTGAVGAVTLTPATLTLTGISVSPTPQPVTIGLTPAALALSAIAVTATPQPVTLGLTPATLTLSAVAVSPVSQSATVNLTPAALTLTARAVTAAPGQVTTALNPAALILSAQALTVGSTGAANLSAAAISLTAIPVTATPQPVTIGLTPAAFTLSPRPVVPTPQPVTLQLSAALIEFGTGLFTVTPGQTTVTLEAALLTLTAVAITFGAPPRVTDPELDLTLNDSGLLLTGNRSRVIVVPNRSELSLTATQSGILVSANRSTIGRLD